MRGLANWLLLALLLAPALAGCGGGGGATAPDPTDAPPQDATRSPRMAIVDYRTGDLSAPETVARYAQADLVVLEGTYLWSYPQNADFVAQVKALNPDVKIIGYVLAKTSWVSWGNDPETDAANNPYGYDWYVATRPYWCSTTTGDTLMDWPGQVVIDIANPDCRRGMIEVIAKYRRESTNRLDGVYWDYFGPQLWISAAADAAMDGVPDIDRNGIGHFDDDAERQAFRDGQTALVQELRAELGEDFIQIFNGGRALADSVFAALGDGMFYEVFPNVGFWGGPPMALALDPARFNNLWAARRWPRTRNGGPWLILSNQTPISWYDSAGQLVEFNLGEINRAAALLTDATSCYHNTNTIGYGWPRVELALGEPLGGVICSGDTLTRDFARGRVRVFMRDGTYPLPFDFEIVADGAVIQALRYPDYTPLP